jgi:hypothetical protein
MILRSSPICAVLIHKLLEINRNNPWHDCCNSPVMRHTHRLRNKECKTIIMKIINTTWTGNTEQVVAFRLPITVWHEEQMEVPVVNKTERLPRQAASPKIRVHPPNGVFEIALARGESKPILG